MLFYENLEEIIFHRHEVLNSVDQFIVLSGYVGPEPIRRLETLPFPSRVVYGMYGEQGISAPLHRKLCQLEKDISNTEILYSKLPIHSKCYMWLSNKKIQHALVGSANFSINGLHSDYREVLAETTFDTFQPLQHYLDFILERSQLCTDDAIQVKNISLSANKDIADIPHNPDVCQLSFLVHKKTGETAPEGSGINWGFAKKGHNKPGDAYIAIPTWAIRQYPNIFPPNQQHALVLSPGARASRQNDAIEIIWDDGTTMTGLMEGSMPVDGISFPKQISSAPDKGTMGKYLRSRMGLKEDAFVTKEDFNRYGRSTIDISRSGDGVYYMDFSSPIHG